MLKSLGTEFKVGLFAIVALATLGYMFFVLSPDTFDKKEYREYYTVLKNASGIIPNSHVKTSGVSVGKVKSVALEGITTRVILNVDGAVPIPVGSRIEIRSVGLLGDVHLEIVRGESTGQMTPDKGFIPQSEEGYDMQTMVALVGDIARDVKKVTTTLANVLGTQKGEQSVQNIVDNIEGVTADLKTTMAIIKNVVGTREQDLNDIITDIRGAVADMRSFSANMKDVLDTENKERIDRILASFDEAMVDVKGSAKSINLIAEKVEKGEGTIGKLVNDDSTLSELEGAIKDIRKVIAPATRLAIEIDYHGEFRRDQVTQHYFNILFRTRPDRFYLLGLTDTTYDRTETRTISDVDDGEDDALNPADRNDGTLVETRERKEKALRFNLQMGKRWYFTTVRFGLFETTGGIAADFHLLDDKLKFSFEAFDWNTADKTERRNAHLKAYASVLFYNHLYLTASVDDPTRTDPETGKVTKKTNYFFGAGLSFTDQDLKAIFGAAALAGAAN